MVCARYARLSWVIVLVCSCARGCSARCVRRGVPPTARIAPGRATSMDSRWTNAWRTRTVRACKRERERERERTWWTHTGGGNALAFKQPRMRQGGAIAVVITIPCYARQCYSRLGALTLGADAQGVRETSSASPSRISWARSSESASKARRAITCALCPTYGGPTPRRRLAPT